VHQALRNVKQSVAPMSRSVSGVDSAFNWLSAGLYAAANDGREGAIQPLVAGGEACAMQVLGSRIRPGPARTHRGREELGLGMVRLASTKATSATRREMSTDRTRRLGKYQRGRS
jgi:hypothetical protein